MKWRIGELLLQKKLISWEQLEEALDEQHNSKELTGEILVRKGFISRSLLYKALAEQTHVRFVELKRTRINPAAVELIPGEFACQHSIFPVEFQDGRITVAVPSPFHMWPESALRQIKGIEEIQTVLSLPAEIEEFLEQYYSAKKHSGTKVLGL